MPEGVNLALLIRGLVSLVLALGGVICLYLGTRLLFRRAGQISTPTTFDAKLGKYNLSFSAGTAGTAVVLTSVVWVFGTIVALPSFKESPQGKTVAAMPLATVPFEGASTTLSAEQRAALDAVVGRLKEAAAGNQLWVASYATVGSPEANLAVADRRGEAVRDYLVLEHGVPEEKVRLISQGKESPFGTPVPQGITVPKNTVAVFAVPRVNGRGDR